jgi:hypothetical protein
MRKIVSLMIAFSLLFTVVSPVFADSELSVVNVPIYEQGYNKQLGTILIRDNPLYPIVGNTYFNVALPSSVTITDYLLSDLNNTFDSVNSTVYDNRKIEVYLGNRLTSEASATISIDIKADLSKMSYEDINVSIIGAPRSGIPMGILTIAKVIDPATYTQRQFIKAFTELKDSKKLSNDAIYAVHIILAEVSKGSLTSTVYRTEQVLSTTKKHSISPQAIETVKRKLTTSLREINQKYGSHDNYVLTEDNYDIVTSYVYGTQKTEIITDFINSIPSALKTQTSSSSSGGGGGGNSQVTTTMTDQAKTVTTTENIAETLFKISADTYILNGEIMTMDVKPYIKNNRTYVPVRYLAYSLGVEEGNITWDSNTRKVTITKDDVTIELIIGSPIMLVNKKLITMDVSPEITDARTMLPARWVAEALGAEVEWDDTSKQAIIKMSIEKEQGD